MHADVKSRCVCLWAQGDGQGWRGRGTALGEILRFWISRSEEPLDVVATIAGDLLLKVGWARWAGGREGAVHLLHQLPQMPSR